MNRPRALAAIALAFYASFVARCLFMVDGRLHATLFDDAMISMRYGRNFAEGFGLVWNPGAAAVQGYTNPSWTFMMAAVHAAGVPPRLASVVIMAIGAAVLVAMTLTTRRLAHLVLEDPKAADAAAALAAFSYALVFWTLRGMEVGLLAWLLTLAALHSMSFVRTRGSRHLRIAAVALILALWTRTDAVVAAVTLSGYILVFGSERPRAAAVLGVVALAGVLGPLAFGWWYYGSALPNSYYLKLGGAGVMARLGRGVPALAAVTARSLAAAIVVAAAILAGARGMPLARQRELGLLGALFAAQCVYSVYVGGDAWEWMGYSNRYMSIALPALAILVAAGAIVVSEAANRARTVAAFFALAAAAQVTTMIYLLRIDRGIDGEAAAFYAAHRAAATGVAIGLALILAAAASAAALHRTVASLVLGVWLLTSAVPATRWAVSNAFLVPEDERAARLGLLFRETLAPGATFAVSWAGSTPYFAERTAVDLLGRSDPVIARMPPHISEFVPGHNKWDLAYSIGRLRPDVACNLPRRPGESEYLASQGYRQIGGTCFARDGARIDASRLTGGIAALFPPGVPAGGGPR